MKDWWRSNVQTTYIAQGSERAKSKMWEKIVRPLQRVNFSLKDGNEVTLDQTSGTKYATIATLTLGHDVLKINILLTALTIDDGLDHSPGVVDVDISNGLINEACLNDTASCSGRRGEREQRQLIEGNFFVVLASLLGETE